MYGKKKKTQGPRRTFGKNVGRKGSSKVEGGSSTRDKDPHDLPHFASPLAEARVSVSTESPGDLFGAFKRKSRQTRVIFDDFLSPAVVSHRRYEQNEDDQENSPAVTPGTPSSEASTPSANFRRVLEGMENIRISHPSREGDKGTAPTRTRAVKKKKEKKKRAGAHKITVRTFEKVRTEDVRSILDILNVAEDCMYEGFRSARVRTSGGGDDDPTRRWTTQKRFRVVQVMLNQLEGCFKREEGPDANIYTDWYGVPKLKEVLTRKLRLDEGESTDTDAASTNKMLSSEEIADIVEREKRRMRNNMKMLRRASFVGRNSIMMTNLLMLRQQEFVADDDDGDDEAKREKGAAATRKSSVLANERRRLSSMLAPRLSALPSEATIVSRTTTTVAETTTSRRTRRNTVAKRLSHLRTSLLPLPSDPILIDRLLGQRKSDAALVSLALSAGVLEFLPPGDLLHVAPVVSTAWRREARRVRSWQAAQISAHVVPVDLLDCWTQLCENFPCGKFLAEGAYKRVFKVFAGPANRAEAVAVMNVRRICEDGQADMVRRELNAGLLLGELSSERVCPHYVEIYQNFQFAYPPPESLWASERGEAMLEDRLEDVKQPQRRRRRRCRRRKLLAGSEIPDEPEEERGVWQYIRMELCDGADAEAMLRKRCETEGEIDDVAFVRECAAMFFQMLVSLRVGIERFTLRHYDIKLLNFMLQSRTCATTYAVFAAEEEEEEVSPRPRAASCVRYVVREDASRYVVKLADWGTAEMDPETIGRPIESAHYTTLENAPPEFMVLGSNGATQGYETDAWAMGLCWLHLLARDAPYEELMDDVTCPPSLFRSLQRLWCDSRDDADGFRVLWHGALEYTPNVRTLADTLWRQLVLCGSFSTLCGSDSEVFALLRRSFGLADNLRHGGADNPTRRTKRRVLQTTTLFGRGEERGRGVVWTQYVKDRKQWCLERGESPHVRAIRSRAASVPGGTSVLKGLLDLNPATRLSVADVLRDGGGGLFETLRDNVDESEKEDGVVIMRL